MMNTQRLSDRIAPSYSRCLLTSPLDAHRGHAQSLLTPPPGRQARGSVLACGEAELRGYAGSSEELGTETLRGSFCNSPGTNGLLRRRREGVSERAEVSPLRRGHAAR